MSPAAVSAASAEVYLAYVFESDDRLKLAGLEGLNKQLGHDWIGVDENELKKLMALCDDADFQHHELAALVVAKTVFHMGFLDQAVAFALRAGQKFDLSEDSLFVKTVLNTAADDYIKQSVQLYNNKATAAAERAIDDGNDGDDDMDMDTGAVAVAQSTIDPRLENFFERIVRHTASTKQGLQHAIGIVIEARRLDALKEILLNGDTGLLLEYIHDKILALVQHRAFRRELLELILEMQMNQTTLDHRGIVQTLLYLNDSQRCAGLLIDLLNDSNDSDDKVLVAFQIGFDIAENATQDLQKRIVTDLKKSESNEKVSALTQIIDGSVTNHFVQAFLNQSNKTDLELLKKVRESFDPRISMYHTALSSANALMNAGTSSDTFLRSSLEWLSRATNWAKFTATAALGVIHKGQVANAQTLMGPYLPQNNVSNQPYSEGGALYALGLICANRGSSIIDYLLNALQPNDSNEAEILHHGASLGIGLAAMGTGSEQVFEALKQVLYTDSAVAGEAAGVAMGLVMMGTLSNRAIGDMLPYAQSTRHEKIIRGLAMGMALVMYGAREAADPLIDRLANEKDAILRYGAMWTMALAYCGTGNNAIIARLLHVAVSDANDDVRRAAVTALGFILCHTPGQVPRMVQLLSQSYNPHVRAGAALALGIACAGTGSLETIELLEPLTKDSIDFVRQSAYIALGMLLIEQSEALNPKVASIRKTFLTAVSNKHEGPLSRMGAAIAMGIVDAGGRNVTISMRSSLGGTHAPAVAGVALFAQFWHWFPFTHMLALAFTPTCFIGITSDLEAPEIQLVSKAPPSWFAYPEPTPVNAKEKQQEVKSAVLSVAGKGKRLARKPTATTSAAATEESNAMDLDEPAQSAATADAATATKEAEAKAKSTTLSNVSRVVSSQVKYVSLVSGSRYVAAIPNSPLTGIVLVKDTKPELEKEPAKFAYKVAAASEETKEGASDSSSVPIPAPFEYPFGEDAE
ncbi:26S proteasome regulatory complex, non-ATPase subcomplex, Rpn2/Psmd1 subunit [Ramicandelaber brevisporus]|nr:26S proteasome regulatory complex, non-ATPase subcomplex, Rpn2/Psmd1 subunit [Ramicandelaber brevisporus]